MPLSINRLCGIIWIVIMFVKIIKNKNMFNKFRMILVAIVGILFFPMATFALSTGDLSDWGGTIGVDSNGNVGGSLCVGTSGVCDGAIGGGGGWAMANPYGLPQGSILGIASNLLFWLLAIFGVLGILGFVISGIFYLVSAGDEGMAEKGKEGMKYSIIGVIIGLSGFLIMQAVAALLSGSSSRF